MAIDWDGELLRPVMATFGEAVIYTPRGQGPVAIGDAVFDAETAEVVIGDDGEPTTQRKPVLGIRIAALGRDPAQGDSVRIVRTGVTYVVKAAEPDGKGHASLSLMLKGPA